MYQFKYTYSNGIEEFNRIFTLEEIGQGWHFYVISDNPLLKDYKIVDRKLSTTQKDINGIEILMEILVSVGVEKIGKVNGSIMVYMK